jgi:hypothetical protein
MVLLVPYRLACLSPILPCGTFNLGTAEGITIHRDVDNIPDANHHVYVMLANSVDAARIYIIRSIDQAFHANALTGDPSLPTRFRGMSEIMLCPSPSAWRFVKFSAMTPPAPRISWCTPNP